MSQTSPGRHASRPKRSSVSCTQIEIRPVGCECDPDVTRGAHRGRIELWLHHNFSKHLPPFHFLLRLPRLFQRKDRIHHRAEHFSFHQFDAL